MVVMMLMQKEIMLPLPRFPLLKVPRYLMPTLQCQLISPSKFSRAKRSQGPFFLILLQGSRATGQDGKSF